MATEQRKSLTDYKSAYDMRQAEFWAAKHDLEDEIYARHLAGESFADMARSMGVARGTVFHFHDCAQKRYWKAQNGVSETK